jgi:hypothetical protein
MYVLLKEIQENFVKLIISMKKAIFMFWGLRLSTFAEFIIIGFLKEYPITLDHLLVSKHGYFNKICVIFSLNMTLPIIKEMSGIFNQFTSIKNELLLLVTSLIV